VEESRSQEVEKSRGQEVGGEGSIFSLTQVFDPTQLSPLNFSTP
jgi:hypothetical protein